MIHTQAAGPPESRRAVTARTLKWIAAVTMLVDHIGAVLVYGLIMHADSMPFAFSVSGAISLYYWMRRIGRVAFPLFALGIVEGFFHTRNRVRYLLRLYLAALLFEIPFDLAFNDHVLEAGYQNVCFTFVIALMALMGFDRVRNSRLPRPASVTLVVLIGVAAPVLAELMQTDYGAAGVVGIELAYAVAVACEGRSLPRPWTVPVLQHAVIVAPLLLYGFRSFWCLAGLPFVALYRGARGGKLGAKHLFSKRLDRWFFYLFYPAHLLILAALAALFFQ